ncbi:hypothetical protein MLD38_012879 [Melastoma candidum]|uniref:Uncharacterized protein n=1 Tax=Melastoma candidum TaxID=119954 RepID=A0ACB9RG72_9MYRT|nr:hypothetical protein MLD38_012879 [Melastoma candidum]
MNALGKLSCSLLLFSFALLCGQPRAAELENATSLASGEMSRDVEGRNDSHTDVLLERQEYGSEDDDDDYGGYFGEDDETLAEKLKHAFNGNIEEELENEDEYKAPAESAADVVRRCIEIEVQEAAQKKRSATLASGVVGASPNFIALKGREKLPVDYLPRSLKPSVEKAKGESISQKVQLKHKPHGQESKEEKKERKAAVKEERREARRTKKEMKGLYKCEAQRAQRVATTTGPSSIPLA